MQRYFLELLEPADRSLAEIDLQVTGEFPIAENPDHLEQAFMLFSPVRFRLSAVPLLHVLFSLLPGILLRCGPIMLKDSSSVFLQSCEDIINIYQNLHLSIFFREPSVSMSDRNFSNALFRFVVKRLKI